MKTDFNSSAEIFTALVGGLKLTNSNFNRGEYVTLGSDKPYLHLIGNTGREYPINILSQTPIKDWKIWSLPIDPKFKKGSFVYDKHSKKIGYIVDAMNFDKEISQFVYCIFEGTVNFYTSEDRLVDFDLIKNKLQ